MSDKDKAKAKDKEEDKKKKKTIKDYVQINPDGLLRAVVKRNNKLKKIMEEMDE